MSNFKITPWRKLPSMYEIMRIGKGSLPKVLGGLFTSPQEAQRHIDKYEESSDGRKGNSQPRV